MWIQRSTHTHQAPVVGRSSSLARRSEVDCSGIEPLPSESRIPDSQLHRRHALQAIVEPFTRAASIVTFEPTAGAVDTKLGPICLKSRRSPSAELVRCRATPGMTAVDLD